MAHLPSPQDNRVDGFLNMAWRDNLVQEMREEFTQYDDLHRLTASALSGYGATNNGIDIDTTYSYDANGNLTGVTGGGAPTRSIAYDLGT